MNTVIDWAAKPEPWCWIGPAFKSEVEAIPSVQAGQTHSIPFFRLVAFKRLTWAEAEWIEFAARRGYTSRAIAAWMGRSQPVVVKHCHRSGMRLARRPGGAHRGNRNAFGHWFRAREAA